MAIDGDFGPTLVGLARDDGMVQCRARRRHVHPSLPEYYTNTAAVLSFLPLFLYSLQHTFCFQLWSLDLELSYHIVPSRIPSPQLAQFTNGETRNDSAIVTYIPITVKFRTLTVRTPKNSM